MDLHGATLARLAPVANSAPTQSYDDPTIHPEPLRQGLYFSRAHLQAPGGTSEGYFEQLAICLAQHRTSVRDLEMR